MKVFDWILPPLLLLQGVSVMVVSAQYLNTPCSTTADCGGSNNHLQCINGYCQCDTQNQIFDQSTNQCLLLIGRQCQISQVTPNAQHQSSQQQQNPMKCVPHADCLKSNCRCKQGYRLTADFLCKPDYGSPCHIRDECDETQGLVCKQGTCHCFNSTWTYQGHFGCVDPANPYFGEMLDLLNQTQFLLKENKLEIKDMFDDLGLQNDPNSEFLLGNALAEARQFQDTYNTNDLQFAAQNQNSQQSGGGFNLGQLFSLFQTVQGLFGRNNNMNQGNQGGGGGGGGGGGFFRNLLRGFGGGGQNQVGYPESGKPEAKPPASGYGPPGPAEMMGGQRFNLISSFLNLFNQMIPIVRQIRMRFSPVRFFQNFLNRFAPTTTAAPPPAMPAAIHNPPPTVIESNGNYQANPIFDNNNQQSNSGDQNNNQGEGTFRFIMRTRNRFRNLLRGQQGQQGGGGGGYDYTPAKPPEPAGGYGAPPPADAPSGGSPPPAEPAGTAGARATNQQSYYASHFNGQQNQQQQQTSNANYNTLPSSPVQQAPAQRQQTFNSLPSPTTFNSNYANPQSFFSQNQQQNHQNAHNNQQQYHNNNHNNFNNNNNNHQNYNAQATSHQQTTFVPHPQPNHNQQQQYSHHNNQHGFSGDGKHVAAAATTTSNVVPIQPPPPPIPQFKLQVQPAKNPIITAPIESLKQNFILSEDDDPHPGFTPYSTPSPHETSDQNQGSYRTAARFERIGQEEPGSSSNFAQNWRDTF